MGLFLLHCIRILVGAPKDNITDPNALLVVRQFVRPGVVYQCPLTTLTGDCTDVKIDRERKFSFCFLSFRGISFEITFVDYNCLTFPHFLNHTLCSISGMLIC